MSGHSKGPWRIYGDSGPDVFVEASDATCVAKVFGKRDPECAANARLIAAAPELLSMLKRHWHASTCRCEDCLEKRALIARIESK